MSLQHSLHGTPDGWWGARQLRSTAWLGYYGRLLWRAISAAPDWGSDSPRPRSRWHGAGGCTTSTCSQRPPKISSRGLASVRFPQQRLRQIDRDDADHVETLATEEAIGCDVNHDDEVALSLGSLVLEPQASPVLDPRRDLDGDALFDADFAATLARWTALRRNGALPAAHRARTIDGEATLSD